ncbi:prolyl endopeptidase-like [Musca vetustissima]|uniref:prolyl endopeptidase-like n=1 Tax=Musca vetustissima TaxID=27455 RepID=UPI002AB6CD3E|nr:prolyl endopeptidase-like [Musca vetustissima]
MTSSSSDDLMGCESDLSSPQYPSARKDESVVETLHGVEVKDVYRWLEDPDSEETKKFIEEQNNISQPYLQGCEAHKKLMEKMTKLYNYERCDCPAKHGKYYYFEQNSGLQNQDVIYQLDSLDGEPRVFFDPNALSSDGTISLTHKVFSEDGKYMAYGLSVNGSDWFTIHIRNVETGRDFDEVLEKVKFSGITWTKDNKGFFYGCFPQAEGKLDGSQTESTNNQKVYYHRLGQSQVRDVLVFELPEEPKWQIQTRISDCGKYLLLFIDRGFDGNLVYYADWEPQAEITGKLKIKKLIDKFDDIFTYITNKGSKMYFNTNNGASNYRVIIIDLENPAEENWQTLIPEHARDVLNWVDCVDNDKLVLNYMHDVKSLLQVNSLESGELLFIFDLDIGNISDFWCDKSESEIFYKFSSFLTPGIIYHYDFRWKTSTPKVWRNIQLNMEGFSPNDYQVEQVFYESKDKTKVPMFVIGKITKEEKRSPRPCLLTGYGGFQVIVKPNFSVRYLTFIDTFDGVVAVPSLRGGNEYGEKWHRAGNLLNKQNVFNDFQAAAEYLVTNNYTTKDRLAIQGGSNGGLLIGACINQRPDLFGAAIARVGVMDMLRFHKFTIGFAWCSEFGNPDKKEHFDNILKYSPLHNVHIPTTENEEYPATLVTTADHDDRVSPLHSLKFVAALQDAVRNSEYQKKPIMLRVYSNAGHGEGTPTSKIIEENTDMFVFILKTLNIEKINL